MYINWYPGHMKKTKELIQGNLKLVDVVAELIDARIPFSSRNPNINEIINNKPRVIILNKADLADPDILKKWINYFKEQGFYSLPFNSLSNQSTRELIDTIKLAAKNKIEQFEKKGKFNRPLRLMIVGIPNVGKSSFINKLAGKKSAKTGNKPGITKGKQWIRIRKDLELFDTPGILWPKINDLEVGLNLAFTGAIKDEILNIEEIALKLLEKLSFKYPKLLMARYNLENVNDNPLNLMEEIGIKRGCLRSKGNIDYTRVSNIILEEFRKGKIGRISLENPDDIICNNKDRETI